MAQPAVSQYMKALEAELGFQLFHRVRRGVELTAAGQAFLPEARAALTQSDRAIRIATGAHSGRIGHLHIGYVHSVMLEPELPAFILKFKAGEPSVTLAFSDVDVTDYADSLLERRIDVAYIRGPLGPLIKDLAAKLFSETRLVVALPANHRLAEKTDLRLQDLQEEAFLLHRDPVGVGLGHQTVELCQTAGFTPRNDLRIHNMSAMVGMVAAGLGISIVPISVARAAPAGVTWRAFRDVDPRSQVWMVHRKTANSPSTELSSSRLCRRRRALIHVQRPSRLQGRKLRTRPTRGLQPAGWHKVFLSKMTGALLPAWPPAGSER